ncbi:DMT family transporter [Aestuariivirga sp.]|jgi:drug/metabolite transporter (DMT)-like permease|uniref:DMT family transporter n=1 Tax=Aestuariivirga sp. TaxID=2650926 RepID=UPI00378432F8
MTVSEPRYETGIIFVLLATVGWSLAGVFVRFLPGLDGWQINCWRGFWMSVFVLVYLVATYGRDVGTKFRNIPPKALIAVASFFTAGSTLYVTSLTLTGTATVSVIGALSPIFAGILSPWITHERPTLASWLAALMALGGAGVIAWDGITAGNLLGMVVCLLVPISFAGQTLALRRYRGIDMVPAICVGGFVTFIVAGVMGYVAGGHPGGGFPVSPQEMILLAFMGPLQLSIPLILYAKGAKHVPAVTLTLVVMLDVVLSPFWAWIGAGELPAKSAYIGGSIIILAVMVSILGDRWMRRANVGPT